MLKPMQSEIRTKDTESLANGVAQKLWVEAFAVVVLVIFGILLRIATESWPNVSPVAAIGLFAGTLLRRAWLAALVPLFILFATDFRYSGYPYSVAIVVYLSLIVPVFAGVWIQRTLDRGGQLHHLQASFSVIAWILICSTLFFAASNFAWFMWGPRLYEMSLSGLIQCYVNAIPFFRNTLIGDFGFAIGFFACLAAWRFAFSPVTRRVHKAV
jgi:hypothetical protein